MTQVKVRGVMTCARHEITYARTMIETAMKQVGVPLQVSLGVFYHQLMQNMFEQALKDEVDYLITVDGDSVFLGHQVHHLISLCAQENMDALCAFQVKRGSPHLLGFKEGATSAKWNGYPIRVDAAHFGLTVLRVKALEKVAKPWFQCQPDKDGGWGDGRIDSDVWFWKQWREAGNSLYTDPGTRIGHVEEMVVMHDDDYKPRHYYPKEWDAYMEGLKKKTEKKDDCADEAVEAVPAGEGVE